MMTMAKVNDAPPTREHTQHPLNNIVEHVRTPLLAALGAAELATRAVVDAINKARVRLSERAEATREVVGELPADLAGLRERLDPAELRKLADEYTEAAHRLYQKLTDAGEDTLAKWRAQPQVHKALDQVEEAITTLQDRVGDVADDARELTEDMLARVTRRTRSAGERAAKTAHKVANTTAEAVIEAGNDVAHEIRSVSRKVAAKTTPAKAPAESSTTAESTTTKAPAARKTATVSKRGAPGKTDK